MANYGRKTPAPGAGAPDRIRITAVDITLARDYVRGAGSKWTKPQITSAADGMAWLIRELPGSAALLSKMLRLMEGHPDPVIAMGDVANLVRAQDLDANILDVEDVPPLLAAPDGGAGAGAAATSTQAGRAENLLDANWDDLSQIPSNQDGSGDSGSPDADGGDGNGDGNCGGNIPDGKVSGHSSCSVRSHAAPPKQPAKVGVVGDGGLVDKDTNDTAVTRDGGVGDDAGVKDGVKDGNRDDKAPKANANSSSSSVWRPRVCNQVWKGKQCPNRSNGCRFAHPTPCSNGSCKSAPAPGCRAFHPPMSKGKKDSTSGRGNDKGSVRKGSAAPKAYGGKGNRRPNHRRNGTSNSNNSSSSRSNNNHSDFHLRRRIEVMEKKLELQAGKTPPSYRDVAARGLLAHSSSNGGNNNNNPTYGRGPDRVVPGGFGHGRPDPAVLSTVVAAVMAVLSGGDQPPHRLF